MKVNGRVVRCQVRGSVEPLLKVLAAAGVTELLSREPSLEELFLAQYGEARPKRAGRLSSHFEHASGWGGSPHTVVARLTARKAVRSGVIWGYIFGASHRLVGDQLHQALQDRGPTGRVGGRLRIEQGNQRALRASSAAPDGGRLHRLQDLHDADHPRRRVGTPDQHEAACAARRTTGAGSFCSPARPPDAVRRPGAWRPRRRRSSVVGAHRSHHRGRGTGLDGRHRGWAGAVLRARHGGNRGHVPGGLAR